MSYLDSRGPAAMCPRCGSLQIWWDCLNDLPRCGHCGWPSKDPVEGNPGSQEPKPRTSRHSMFMAIAKVVAQRGTCDRARVGAVLVNSKNKIVSIGYNGAPAGEKHCDEVGHLIFDDHCIRTIHAEENCLQGVTLSGKYTLYVTHYPCSKCQITMFEKLMGSIDNTSILVVFDELYGSRTSFESLPEVQKVLQFSSLQESKSLL